MSEASESRSARAAGPARAVVPGARAAQILARLTLVRVFRGRAMWFSLILALIPVMVMLATASSFASEDGWENLFAIYALLLTIIPPVHMAPILGEEVEDRTFTYLWSRPLPRWSVIVGKLAALVPVAAGLIVGSLALVFVLARAEVPTLTAAHVGVGAAALFLGTLAVGSLSAALGTLIPKHAVASAIVYFLILDSTLAAIPFSIENLSVLHHVTQLAQASADPDPALTAVIWLVAMTAVGLALALWRVGRAEFNASDG